MTCANSNGYLQKRRVNTFDQVAIDSLLSQDAFVFEGRKREGTIQDFSMIHRYFSTNLNQMILYTVV